jgi:hypothetical protein
LGIGDWAQSPIPNPQSPIPNPQIYNNYYLFLKIKINIYNYLSFLFSLLTKINKIIYIL